ncbi:MAG: azurin [Pseudoxanthomonas sp.]
MKIQSLWAMMVLATAAAIARDASARTCALEIFSNDAMRFDQVELKVDASCGEVSVTLHHTGRLAANIMGHNWVLAKTADVAAITRDGIQAGAANDYLAPGDIRVLAHTKVIGGGQSTTVTFKTSGLTRAGDYSFFCSFPGHSALMRGRFIFG